jgi:hypothetical protein
MNKDIQNFYKIFKTNPKIKSDGNFQQHILFKTLVVESGSPYGKGDALKIIKSCGNKAEKDNTGVKRICIYYTGHSNKAGNWVYPNGEITLLEVCAQFKIEDHIRLYLYIDTSYAGTW